MKRIKQNPNPNKVCVLSLDPSLTGFGYAVVQGRDVIYSGMLSTKKANKKLKIRTGDDRCNRVNQFANLIKKLVKKYKVQYIVSEQPHGSQSSSAAVSLGLMIGMIETYSVAADIPLEWYSERDCKKTLFGRINVTKDETVYSINLKYNNWRKLSQGNKARNEAVADALAVHYHASHVSPVIKFLSKNPNYEKSFILPKR